MSYYHATKQSALDLAKETADMLGEGWEARAELEPDNGWVVVVGLVSPDGLPDTLRAVLALGELDLGRARKRPATHKRPAPQPPAAPKRAAGEPAPQWQPGAKLPWEA